MSDKTTEEAAEEYAKDLYPNTAAYNAIAYRGYINGAASLSAIIAQLREENDKFKGVMKQASGHLTNLQLHIEQLERRHRLFIDTHVDMVMEVMSQALTPKPPKTNG